MRRCGPWVVLLGLLALMAGCATPALGSQDYLTKTKDTANALAGVANSARLAASAWLDGKATRPFVDSLVTQMEDSCGSISTTYDSRQPPDAQSAALRKRADPVIQQTCSTISDLRIALRTGENTGVRQAVHDLMTSAAQLQSLQARLS